ncbi:MAG: alpha/beta hydrolase [Candidatus Acidiferrales bacterium]
MLRDSYAELETLRLHCAESGADDGALLLFAHGFPEFSYAWKNQLAEFGRTHHAVAPDLRGYNLSSKPPNVEDYALPHLVEDIRGLAAHFGCGGENKFTLVGHDWGGVIAWAFAIVHPDWLERLIIINGPHPAIFRRELAHNRAQQKASEYIQHLRNPIAETMLSAEHFAALSQIVLAPGIARGYFNDADRNAYLAAWSQPGALTGSLNYYRAMSMDTVGDELPTASVVLPGAHSWVTQVPTMVLWGLQDTYCLPGNLDGLEDYVTNLRVERISNGTHWVVHELPAVVNRKIRDFLGSEPM